MTTAAEENPARCPGSCGPDRRAQSTPAISRSTKVSVIIFSPHDTFLYLAPVAQLDRASGYEPEGREFESLRAHHTFPLGRQVSKNFDWHVGRWTQPRLFSGESCLSLRGDHHSYDIQS